MKLLVLSLILSLTFEVGLCHHGDANDHDDDNGPQQEISLDRVRRADGRRGGHRRLLRGELVGDEGSPTESELSWQQKKQMLGVLKEGFKFCAPKCIEKGKCEQRTHECLIKACSQDCSALESTEFEDCLDNKRRCMENHRRECGATRRCNFCTKICTSEVKACVFKNCASECGIPNGGAGEPDAEGNAGREEGARDGHGEPEEEDEVEEESERSTRGRERKRRFIGRRHSRFPSPDMFPTKVGSDECTHCRHNKCLMKDVENTPSEKVMEP